MQVILKVIDDHGSHRGKIFGPFDSEDSARKELEEKGWTENVNGRKGEEDIWYCQTELYGATRVRMILLSPTNELPIEFAQT